MMDLRIGLYLISILAVAIIHTLGEVIYKKGTTPLVESNWTSQTKSSIQTLVIPIIVIVVSFGISLVSKIIYGILLGSNPLSSTAAFFLGSVAIFSIILGKIFFHEQLSPYQVLGIVLIISGIVLVI